jgi:hypothetical protein
LFIGLVVHPKWRDKCEEIRTILSSYAGGILYEKLPVTPPPSVGRSLKLYARNPSPRSIAFDVLARVHS